MRGAPAVGSFWWLHLAGSLTQERQLSESLRCCDNCMDDGRCTGGVACVESCRAVVDWALSDSAKHLFCRSSHAADPLAPPLHVPCHPPAGFGTLTADLEMAQQRGAEEQQRGGLGRSNSRGSGLNAGVEVRLGRGQPVLWVLSHMLQPLRFCQARTLRGSAKDAVCWNPHDTTLSHP